jgi:hypothetical protein
VHASTWRRLCWSYTLLLLASVCLIRIVLLFQTPASRATDIVEYFYDDGYYYLSVAANIADSARSTFDGLTLTNGYQPLWLLILTALALAVGTAPHTLFVAACVLVSLIVLATLLAAGAWRRSSFGEASLCFAVGLGAVVLRWPMAFVQGLETVLLLPLALAFVLQIERLDGSRRQLLLLSGLLSVMFLVRLDYLSLYACTGAALLLRPRWFRSPWIHAGFRGGLRAVAGLSLFVLPILVLYLLINKWLFDSIVPVSGLAKSIGGPKFSNWGVQETFLESARQSALLLVPWVALEYVVRRLMQPGVLFYRSLGLFAVAALLQCLYFCTLYTWYVMPWYECFVMLCAALIVARIVYLSSLLGAFAWKRSPRWLLLPLLPLAGLAAWMGLAAISLADKSIPIAARTAIRRTLHVGNPEVADILSFNQVSLVMLAEFFDPHRHTLIAMGDRAGGIAYWGRGYVSVVQLEGLMLDKRYIDALLQRRAEAYLEQNFPIETFVIDREVVPTLPAADGSIEYVIPDPVRGRVTVDPVPTFCFPASAVRYTKSYATFTGAETRMAFDFAARIPCSANALALVTSIEHGIGLQQYSLPSEYDFRGGFADSALEKRDRHAAARTPP